MTRVAVLTASPGPYRLPFLRRLALRCDLEAIFDCRLEGNRLWQMGEIAFPHRYVAGIAIPYRRRRPDGVPGDRRFLQIRYGLLPRLLATRPTVVVSAEFGLRSLQAALYCRLTGRPLILWSEGTPHSEGWVRGLKRRIRRFLVSRADRFWVNGVESAALILHYGGKQERIDAGMTGVDTQWFSEEVDRCVQERDFLRTRYGLRGTCFLFVGQLVPRKGIREFLMAVEELARQETGFSVLFVGDGEERGFLECWMQLHADVNVRVLGYRQQSELPEIYAAADVFVLPTLDDNWSLVTLEAAASGLPQLCSKFNGSGADLIPQGAAGVLFDPSNTGQFTELLAASCRNPPSRVVPQVVRDLVRFYSPEAFAGRAWRSIRAALDTRGSL
jgi:glycosyltransferase involved in cell wall biosynthesis